MLIKDHGGTVPSANADCMRELAELDVLDESLAEQMASAAAFKNVLSHQCGRILDDEIVHDALHDLERFENFLGAIRAYLERSGALD